MKKTFLEKSKVKKLKNISDNSILLIKILTVLIFEYTSIYRCKRFIFIQKKKKKNFFKLKIKKNEFNYFLKFKYKIFI
jgi:hypothetical protein